MRTSLVKRASLVLSLTSLVLICAAQARARVVRVEVLSRADVLGGRSFGDAGAYEKIIAKAFFAVRPDDEHNKQIVDLGLAPRDARGEVEFAADLYILKPKDMNRASGSLLIEIPNRGGKGILRIANRAAGSNDPTTEAEFGDGFLMRRGLTIVWVGWQFDARDEAGLMRLYAPVARAPGGKPITGLVRSDFVPSERVYDFPLGHVISGMIGGTEYAASDPQSRLNVLTVRDAPAGERQVIPQSRWSFARMIDGKLAPDDRFVHLASGFEPGRIYEVVYVARDPVVVGLGLAAARDVAAYFKHDPASLAPAQRVYALGISQSGRFLRHFLLQGFNADEASRRAFDGMFIHVAGAGLGSFNHRFAQPSRDAQPTSALFYPTDLFPFADEPQIDPRTNRRAGLLDRARAASVVPKIFYTNTSYEYWSRAASLIHTTPDGKRDLAPDANARIYLLTGLQHYSPAFPPERSTNPALPGANVQNPLPVAGFWRALIADMDAWVRDGTSPPPSRYPRLADGTLVPVDKLAFPSIPGVQAPRGAYRPVRLDFGAEWTLGRITRQPPLALDPFPTFVPRIDRDGNELAGVRLPQLVAPLATYTGWNLRAEGAGLAGERVSFLGSYFPFARTSAERAARCDPRPSLEERYASRESYLRAYRAAAEELIGQRFLLREDLEDAMRRGAEEWDYAAGGATQQDGARRTGLLTERLGVQSRRIRTYPRSIVHADASRRAAASPDERDAARSTAARRRART